MKQTIKLRESELKKIIDDSVRRALNEIRNTKKTFIINDDFIRKNNKSKPNRILLFHCIVEFSTVVYYTF